MTPIKSETPQEDDRMSRRDLGRAAVVALLAGLVYLLSSGAHAYSVDEITNYASARALVETGSPDLAGEQPFPREPTVDAEAPVGRPCHGSLWSDVLGRHDSGLPRRQLDRLGAAATVASLSPA